MGGSGGEGGDQSEVIRGGGNPIQSAMRTAEFWRRATGIYLSYKLAQGRAKLMRMRGRSVEEVKEMLWTPHHSWAGDEMYSLAIDLRGFYLKVFQFIGARGDFVPEPICRKLSRLHDEVPPMPPQQVKKIILKELGVSNIHDVFEWIDLEKPLGSASLAQVHKARLVRPGSTMCLALPHGRKGFPDPVTAIHKVKPGETLFKIAKANSLTIREILAKNPGLDQDKLLPGLLISLPVKPDASPSAGTPQDVQRTVAACAAKTSKENGAPDGVVVVKVQYPDASREMAMDLGNIRSFAYFLSKTELKFDLVSAVNELADQIRLEFFFKREARVMDTIAGHLKNIRRRVLVPTSVDGLVTDRMLVMQYLDGVQITKMQDKMDNLSPRARKMAARRVLTRVSEAYGRMLLLEGLFQADGHPGKPFR
uniref:LysM domain-containing protein n=1 Tax=Tetraselmis chuii TaxID=63592 RepID=A0A7S1WZN2_9CHLO|mmetsp:Transcript_13633/g.24193  ORF Transcript_13633/g.24193 Transcript_13633/m.24193 type:complete len:422 (+) Transcript_13633:2-1267(+)